MAHEQKRHAAKTTPPVAEVTFLSAEELYRRIADSAYDWEYWLDPEGNCVFVSPSCERLTGYTPEEFLADSGLAERLVHPDDKVRFELHVERAHPAEQQQKASEIELRIIVRDGSERWINHRCMTMFDPDGHYLGRRVSNVDVNRYKLAEEKLLLLNRELLAIRDCARTVLRATDELKLVKDVLPHHVQRGWIPHGLGRYGRARRGENCPAGRLERSRRRIPGERQHHLGR